MEEKGRVCVTGGTGYLGSWMVKRLLQDGYSVNTTVREICSHTAERKRDTSFLTDLPGASERLRIFNADLDRPDSFGPAIEGCVGVFHMAHPLDFEDKETEEVKMKRIIGGLHGVLQACIDAKTVKRVVHTSSLCTMNFNSVDMSKSIVDESSWTDVEFVRSLGAFAGTYVVTKTLTERAAINFAEEHGLDLVMVNPTVIHGPFICPRCPDTVRLSMALIFGGDESSYQYLVRNTYVHVDDVARAHVHLFEHPNAKGRYICSAIEVTIDQLYEFISSRYPQFQIPSRDSWKDVTPGIFFTGLSSEKLLKTGFKYEYGLEEMFDGAIRSCKKKAFCSWFGDLISPYNVT